MKRTEPNVRRERSRTLLTTAGIWGFAALFGCSPGTLGDGRQVILPDATVLDAAANDAGIVSGDTGVSPDTGTVFEPFPSATVGRKCGTGTADPYIVLSAVAPICDRHAALIDTWDGTPIAHVRLPQTSGSFEATTTVCLNAQGCLSLPVTFTIDTWTENQGATGSWTFDLPDGGRAEGTFDADWCAYDEFLPNGGTTLASDLAVDSVKILQGTTVALMQDDAPVSLRNAPVVEGRPGRLRVFVQPLAGYIPRDIVARLTLRAAGQEPVVLEIQKTVSAASEENDFGTTFNFDLNETRIVDTLEWSVGLFEPAACGVAAGDITRARFPSDGTLTPLGAESMGGVFNVVLVPFRYNADGSGRLPDISPEQITRYRNTMFAQFPIAGLNLTVREPVDFPDEIVRDDAVGWTSMLDALLLTRANDAPPNSYYYYGIVVPENDARTYCGQACIAGLGPVASLNSIFLRGAVGLGYTGQVSAETFTHEIGHATGRLHAPCGTTDADRNYP
ncbi:MAG: hypothetical protein AAF449_09245, partial [Myxococcota bacterium]